MWRHAILYILFLVLVLLSKLLVFEILYRISKFIDNLSAGDGRFFDVMRFLIIVYIISAFIIRCVAVLH